MDYYKSPSVQTFERSTTPASTVVLGPGVATAGFSTMGPLNVPIRFNSYEDFIKTMGNPVPDYPMAHLMVRRVFDTGAGGVYFVRAGEEDTLSGAKKADVKVTNHVGATVGKYFYESIFESESNKVVTQPFLAVNNNEGSASVVSVSVIFTVEGAENSEPITKRFSVIKNNVPYKDKSNNTVKEEEVYGINLVSVVDEFNNTPEFKQYAKMKSFIRDDDGKNRYGIYIETNGYEVGVLSVAEEAGYPELYTAKRSDSDGFDVAALAENDKGTADPEDSFTIEAKYPGSGMNGYSVKKFAVKSQLGSEKDTFTVEVRNKENILVETFSGLTEKTFVKRINNESYGSKLIYIYGYEDEGSFVDGTYVLGEGTLIADGKYSYNTQLNEPTLGTDGVPEGEENIAASLEVAISSPSLYNMDNVYFSIVAVPDSQNYAVQDATIRLAEKRGDTFSVIDVPLDYSGDKGSIREAVGWHNGKTDIRAGLPLESSYAGIYYGWATILNVFNNANIKVPPSVLVVPRMLLVDAEDGSFYAPAGASRGRVIASDLLYSPDLEDREEMMGGENCINPIIFSNTRGLLVYGQKTADRTTSALNRINVRRMINEIKRRLYVGLDEVRFELNNDNTQSRASNIASDVLTTYRIAGALEMFTVDVSSPGGADRDVLNVAIELIPVGLVERIRIFINITDGGVSASEN